MGKEVVTQGIAHNIIAQGTKITGTIETEKDIRIDGSLEGDLICKGKVVIGQQGKLKGTINCHNAEIMGNIEGKVTINESLTLKSTATIIGEIKTKILTIEPNAKFNGTCDMSNTNEATRTDATKK